MWSAERGGDEGAGGDEGIAGIDTHAFVNNEMTPLSLLLILSPLLFLLFLLALLAFRGKLKRKSSVVRWDRLLGPAVARLPAEQVVAAQGMRVAVVGGGLAGCVAAHTLANLGIRVTLYEREGQVGGRAATVRHQCGKWSVRVERGVDCFTSGCLAAQALTTAVGLQQESASINDYMYVMRREAKKGAVIPGRSWRTVATASEPGTPFTLTRTDQFSMLKLRVREMFSREWWDALDPLSLRGGDGSRVKQSMGALARSLLTPTVCDSVVEPLCRTMFHTSPDRLPAGWLYGLLAGQGMALCWNVDGGMSVFIQRLMDVHINPKAAVPASLEREEEEEKGEAAPVDSYLVLKCGAAVSSLSLLPNNTLSLTYTKTTPSDTPAPLQQAEFDCVIVCTPAPIAQALTATLPPSAVPPPTRRYLSSAQYRPSCHVAFMVRTYEFSCRPKCPNVVPVRMAATEPCPPLEHCPPWLRNAVAYVAFPSGRLEFPVPPGSECVCVPV